MSNIALYKFILQAYMQKDVKMNEVKIYLYVKSTDDIGKHFKSKLRATQITMAN